METKVAHCPKCQKPVVTGAEFNGPVKFTLRCPSCQQPLQVRVMVRVIAELLTGRAVKQPTNNPPSVVRIGKDWQ